MSSGTRKRLDDAPTKRPLELAVAVEVKRLEPGEPVLLGRTSEQLEGIG